MSYTDIEVLRHDEHRRCHVGACCCGFCGSEPVDGTNTQSRPAEPLRRGFCSSEPIVSANAAGVNHSGVTLATLDTATLRRIHAYMRRVGDVHAPVLARTIRERQAASVAVYQDFVEADGTFARVWQTASSDELRQQLRRETERGHTGNAEVLARELDKRAQEDM